MGIVYVTNLETGALAAQTTGAKGRQTALVGDFGQRVGLVHELRQGVGAEEGVDDRRDGLGVDKLDGGKGLVVAHVHALLDGAGHAGQADGELVVQLLADGAHTTVGQVVDVVDVGLGVDELDKVFDYRDDVLAGKHGLVHGDVKIELFVDAVTAYVAQVVALLAEEEVGDNLAGAILIRRLGVAQLSVDVGDCLFL